MRAIMRIASLTTNLSKMISECSRNYRINAINWSKSRTKLNINQYMIQQHLSTFDAARPILQLVKPADFVEHLARCRKILLQTAANNTRRQQQLMKKRYDCHRTSPTYDIGQLVFIIRRGMAIFISFFCTYSSVKNLSLQKEEDEEK